MTSDVILYFVIAALANEHLVLCFSVKSPLEKTRYDTSLGLLTKKFVNLLRSAPDGVSRPLAV